MTLEKIVRKFGFIEKGVNSLKGKIYSTSLAELKKNKSVGKGRKYKKFFKSIIVTEGTAINIDDYEVISDSEKVHAIHVEKKSSTESLKQPQKFQLKMLKNFLHP